jgi:hypothetical protein
MDRVHCRSCGLVVSPDSVSCPECRPGVWLTPARVRTPSAAVILALIFVFPLGLYLMWHSSEWSTAAKWGISGLFLPPLWGYFIWRLHVGFALKLFLSAALVALVELFDSTVIGVSGTVQWFTALLNVLTLWLVARASFEADAADRMRHRAIERKLDACHELIAEIELYPLPSGSPLRFTYLHALDMREEGARIFEDGVDKDHLAKANSRLTAAQAELSAILRGIPERVSIGTE